MNSKATTHDTFRRECLDAGLAVEDYRGRSFYDGSAVYCDSRAEFLTVIRATSVPLLWDELGRGWIVYPEG